MIPHTIDLMSKLTFHHPFIGEKKIHKLVSFSPSTIVYLSIRFNFQIAVRFLIRAHHV